MPGGGGGADLDVVTAGAGDVLAGKVIVGPDGEPLTGTMANQGAKTVALNCGGSYMIPSGYHNGAGKVTANSLASQTPGNLAANKMLAGTYGYSNGARVDGNIASQGALTLNPGTTAKTGSVSGKYMTGNITVPAISIPANYIKKNQRITFPDGSYVNGTFEGYVVTPQDLYVRGQNPSNFTRYYGGSSSPVFDSGQITIMDINSLIYAQNQVSLTGYTKFNVELKRGSTNNNFDGKITIGQYDSGYSFTGPTLSYTLPNSVGNYTISIDISSFQKTFSNKFGIFFSYLSIASAPGAVYRIWLS